MTRASFSRGRDTSFSVLADILYALTNILVHLGFNLQLYRLAGTINFHSLNWSSRTYTLCYYTNAAAHLVDIVANFIVTAASTVSELRLAANMFFPVNIYRSLLHVETKKKNVASELQLTILFSPRSRRYSEEVSKRVGQSGRCVCSPVESTRRTTRFANDSVDRRIPRR